MQYYAADTWNALRDLTLSLGIRFEPTTRPVEVNGLSDLPYRCDCNNFAPSLGFAYRTPVGVLRGAYGLQYGEIFTATYTQERFNPPGNIRINVVAPNLLDPLAGMTVDAADPSARSTIIRLAPDLVSPYSHQYNFSWEVANSRGLYSQLGYVGSRTHRLISGWVLNRARDVEGIDRTTRTVNLRRPDSRYYDVRRILNGSRAYFDAAKATLGVRDLTGLTMEVSYWMSKAIDLGAHYASNASSRDAFAGRSQTELEVHGDVKSLSDFDQTHAAVARVNYRMPSVGPAGSALNRALGGWELYSVVLLKTGTPFVMYNRLGRSRVRERRRRHGRPPGAAGSLDPGPQHCPPGHVEEDACRARPSTSCRCTWPAATWGATCSARTESRTSTFRCREAGRSQARAR